MDPTSAPQGRSGAREIAGFELLAKLGQGGMGVVYKARQSALDRIVALKVLAPAVSGNKVFIERFQREARASASLNHPNIVQGIAVGLDEASGRWYFAMEFVDGPSLKQVLDAEKKIPEERVLAIARDMALALECAHRHGFVHRDIKPDNIMLESGGTAKLADLGLARRVEGPTDATLTQSGMAVGTPAYMAPEQIRGERDAIDIRTDLYSLGATLFHLVTGRLPFDGPSSAVIMSNHLTKPVPSARKVDADVSEAFSKLIARLMQKERAQRIQAPSELLAELERLGREPNAAALPKRRMVKGAAGARASAREDETPGAKVPKGGGSGQMLAIAGAAAVLVLVAVVFLRSKPESNASEVTERPNTAVAIEKEKPVVANTSHVDVSVAVPKAPAPVVSAAASLDPREEFSRRRWDEIRKQQGDGSLAGEALRKTLEEFVASQGSTRAGAEGRAALALLPAVAVQPVKVPEAVAPAVLPVAVVALPSPAPEVAAKAAGPVSDEVELAYNTVTQRAYMEMRNQQFTEAGETLKQARVAKELVPFAAEFERDMQALRLTEEACKAALEGANQLADGRVISLLKNDGKELKVGKGTPNKFLRAKDGVLQFEQDLAGGGHATATIRLRLDQLAPRSVYELLLLGNAPGADGDLHAGAWCAAVLASCKTPPGFKQATEHLERAGQDAAKKIIAEHLSLRAAMFARDLEVEALQKAIDALIKEKQWSAAETGLLEAKKAYRGLPAFERWKAEYAKRFELVENELYPLKPGLWATYYAGDKKLLTRVEKELAVDFKGGSPDPAVPADYFNARLGGILKAPVAGRYGFRLYADDYLGLYIDGKRWMEVGTLWVKPVGPEALQLNREVEVDLAAGNHKIKLDYREVLGNAVFSLNWKVPGKEWVVIPVEAIWHDPRDVSGNEAAP